ncbi:hypothetical protein BBJ28_00024539, partial [Nothophytophthora sp. Chile5]
MAGRNATYARLLSIFLRWVGPLGGLCLAFAADPHAASSHFPIGFNLLISIHPPTLPPPQAPSSKSRSMAQHETTTAALNLGALGIENGCKVFHNLTYEQLADHEKKYNEGAFVANGTFAVDTGKFTGRSPKDKFIVKQEPSQDNVWWGEINHPTSPEVFDTLLAKATKYFSTVDRMYVFDGHCGVNEKSRLNVRIVTELAWQHHFVTNMFIRPEFASIAENFKADFTIINACNIVDEDWQAHGLHSEVFVIFNIEKHLAVIGGTFYGGEMKKGIFSMMNYYLPLNGVMAMHASANIGKAGDTAIFFGLSGTGKTTLSADPKRELIG